MLESTLASEISWKS